MTKLLSSEGTPSSPLIVAPQTPFATALVGSSLLTNTCSTSNPCKQACQCNCEAGAVLSSSSDKLTVYSDVFCHGFQKILFHLASTVMVIDPRYTSLPTCRHRPNAVIGTQGGNAVPITLRIASKSLIHYVAGRHPCRKAHYDLQRSDLVTREPNMLAGCHVRFPCSLTAAGLSASSHQI